MKKMKELHEITFEELVDEAACAIHSALLESGGKGLKGSIHCYLSTAIRWREAVDKHENKKK